MLVVCSHCCYCLTNSPSRHHAFLPGIIMERPILYINPDPPLLKRVCSTLEIIRHHENAYLCGHYEQLSLLGRGGLQGRLTKAYIEDAQAPS